MKRLHLAISTNHIDRTATVTLLWQALLTAIFVGFAIATPMTAVDWFLNPDGLFHTSQGTNWSVVGETFASWFWPLVVAAGILVLPGFFWVSRRTQADNASGN